MRSEIFIAYEDSSHNDFQVDDNFFSEMSYVDALKKSLDSNHSDIINYNAKKTENKRYAKCVGSILNVHFGEMTPNEFMENYVVFSNSPIILKLDMMEMDDEFYDEFMRLVFTTKKMMGAHVNMANFPFADFKISFKHEGQVYCFNLKSCKISRILDDGIFMLAPANITLIR